MLPDNMLFAFNNVGNNFLQNGFISDALQVFILTKHVNKLLEFGELCLSKREYDMAFRAFKFAGVKDKMVDIGFSLFSEGKIKEAYRALKLSGDSEMVKFFETNFGVELAFYS